MVETYSSAYLVPRWGEDRGIGNENIYQNRWVNIARPLADLRKLLAGPPMTEQERDRQTLTEARLRNAAGLHGFYRSPF
jgi:hypothetical protein